MALASSSFMTGTGAWGSALLTKLDKIDMSQILSAVLMADKELLGHIKMGPPAQNIEVNWLEDELVAATFNAIATATSTSISLIGFSTSASVERMFTSNTIVQPDGADWWLQVQITDGASCLETLLYPATGGISYATTGFGTTCTWRIIGTPYSDLATASEDRSQLRAKRRNFTQVFERAIAIDQTRKGIAMEAVVDELQQQIKYRTLELKRELDLAVINGVAYADAAATMSPYLLLRTMHGIIAYIRDYDLDNTQEDTMVTQVSAALTIAHVNDLLYKIWDAGGLDEASDAVIVVGGAQQRVIASWEKELRRVEQGERQVGYYRDVFLSDMGKEFPIVLDRWMPKDKLLVLDRNRVSLRALSGDAWHMEKMAKTGRQEKWQLSGQYTLEIRNADKCHGLLYDLT